MTQDMYDKMALEILDNGIRERKNPHGVLFTAGAWIIYDRELIPNSSLGVHDNGEVDFLVWNDETNTSNFVPLSDEVEAQILNTVKEWEK